MSQERSMGDDEAEFRERIRDLIEADRELLDALDS